MDLKYGVERRTVGAPFQVSFSGVLASRPMKADDPPPIPGAIIQRHIL